MKDQSLNIIRDAMPTCTSYAAVVIGYVQDINLMQAGAVVLLLARMAIDLPPAYRSVKSIFIKKKPVVRKKVVKKRR